MGVGIQGGLAQLIPTIISQQYLGVTPGHGWADFFYYQKIGVPSLSPGLQKHLDTLRPPQLQALTTLLQHRGMPHAGIMLTGFQR